MISPKTVLLIPPKFLIFIQKIIIYKELNSA
jgi:hypothetical protein